MRNHVLKTALITLAVTLGVIVISVVGCMLFFPSVVSDITYNMGMYGASAEYAEKAFVKDGSDVSLHTLMDRAILAGNDELVVEYGDEFVDGEYFKNEITAENADYYLGSLAVSQYKTGEGEAALETVIFSAVKSFRVHNPTENLMRAVIENDDKTFASLLLAEMKDYDCVNYTDTERQRYNEMLTLLEGFVSAVE